MAHCVDETTRCIYVDLDGSLVATDLLWESCRKLIRARPLALFQILLWMLRGKAFFKREVANRTSLDPAALPYRQDVLDYLVQCRREGRSLVLATAADGRLARQIADHLGLFDCILASDGQTNLQGRRKLQRIREHADSAGFDYVGDSAADLPLFAAADQAILVHPTSRLIRRAKRICSPHRIFPASGNPLADFVAMMRMHQWSKNLLMVVPLLTSHRVADLGRLVNCAYGILTFCFVASAGYIINDLLDLAADRRHPTKKLRPLASGRISIRTGVITCLLSIITGMVLSFLLPPPFPILALVYLGTSISYSLYFKRKLLLDVLCLAGLYTYRILIGGVTVAVVLSTWLLAFSMFLFLSLAFLKRYTELVQNGNAAEHITGRGYLASDIALVRSVGPACACMCILLLCLYINSPEAAKIYRTPGLLWLVCPVLMYWVIRMWFLVDRRQMADDPVLFAMKDKVSLIAASIMGMMVIAASI